jgi:hypothetical protein
MNRWHVFRQGACCHVLACKQAPTVKAAMQCLGQLLAAMDPTNWPAAAAPWALLLSFLTDARPKVRKRAAASAEEVLAALQGTPALAPASEALAAGGRAGGAQRAGG